MNKYVYDGPVQDGQGGTYAWRWKASTVAVSEQKALNNLSYRFKKENGMFKGARVVLVPSKLVVED